MKPLTVSKLTMVDAYIFKCRWIWHTWERYITSLNYFTWSVGSLGSVFHKITTLSHIKQHNIIISTLNTNY